MELLFYSSKKNGAGRRVQNIIEGLIPEEDIGIFRTVEALADRLRQFRHNLSLAVILARTHKEFKDVLLIRDLLSDLPIILILPDRDKNTISQGHSLYPRFLTYSDGDFTDVAAVLEKMLNNMESKHINLLK